MVFHLKATSVLVTILLVLILKHVVNIVGKSAILDRGWHLYTIIASKAGHPKFAELAQKRRQMVEVNIERKSISAQDQYARWTKLNRLYDRLSTEVNSLGESVSAEKARVSMLIGLLLMALTTVPIWFARFWYRKIVLFYFPPNVLPYPIEWLVALPFTVTGGVGLTAWMFAINSVLSSVSLVAKYLTEPAVEKPLRGLSEKQPLGLKTPGPN